MGCSPKFGKKVSGPKVLFPNLFFWKERAYARGAKFFPEKVFSPLNRRGGSGVARWRERGMSLPLRFVG